MKHNGETQRSSLLSATLQDLPDQPEALVRARAFAESLLMGAQLDTGEDVLAHADSAAQILSLIGGSEAMQAACYLVYAAEYLQKPEEVIAKAFGPTYAELSMETSRLIRVQRLAEPLLQSRRWRRYKQRMCARCCWHFRETCASCCCA
jgi:GTP pyrophosphokinase